MPRTAVNTNFTWIGNNGAVVPLQTRDYQIDDNGNFTFATQADERGYMSAGPMLGVGRITAGSRYQTEDGHDQMHLQDSGISSIYDLDDDADIRIVVRKIPAGGGAPVPLEGAIVIASASESIDTTFPAFDDPDNDSGFVNLSQVPTFSFNNQLRNNMQLSELKRAVASSMMAGAAAKSAGRQNPDAYAYEIVARIDRRVMTAEVFDGSIPGGLARLIRQLSRYLPSER